VIVNWPIGSFVPLPSIIKRSMVVFLLPDRPYLEPFLVSTPRLKQESLVGRGTGYPMGMLQLIVAAISWVTAGLFELKNDIGLSVEQVEHDYFLTCTSS